MIDTSDRCAYKEVRSTFETADAEIIYRSARRTDGLHDLHELRIRCSDVTSSMKNSSFKNVPVIKRISYFSLETFTSVDLYVFNSRKVGGS